MDDFYVFLKNDRNFFFKQIYFIISVISFLFLILTSSVNSVIVALAIPGSVINTGLLLIQYYLDERHDSTDIEILITYGVLNLLAAMIFINKTLQMNISIFRMLFFNTYTINCLFCLCLGLLMLGEGIYRIIFIIVRNIYNNTQNSQNLNLLLNGKELNSSVNVSAIHKNLITPDVDSATNTSPNVSNFKVFPTNILTYAEKDTNTNSYGDMYMNKGNPTSLPVHPVIIPNIMDNCTECFHYDLNCESDKHHSVDRHNSGDNGYTTNNTYMETDRRSGDGIHCNKEYEKCFANKESIDQTQYFYPKPHVMRPWRRHSKNVNCQNSNINEAGLPVFVDRYGKKYIASLAGGVENHRCSANQKYDTSSGDFKNKISTPINEYYTNRKYSNSKVTITPSKDEVNTNDGMITDTKVTHDPNVTNHNSNNNTNNNNNSNSNINKNNNTRIVNNENMHNISNHTNKATDNNEFLTNYNNYLAHLYKQDNCNNDRKLFNYKFYNHNYDYQWVCEA